MGPSSTALQTCKEFATILAPLVPIREMDGSGGSTVVVTDTSTRDKTSVRGMESDSQSMGYEDSQFLDSQVASASCEKQREPDISLPLQPDESNLIPVPDLAKVASYIYIHDMEVVANSPTNVILCRCFRPRANLLEGHMQTPTFQLSNLGSLFDSVSLMQTSQHLWIQLKRS